ncbi:MAG: hypothetical protein A3G81_23320 [Betaproteobacteria bacterium RIFCSPLOWO2_12_FULL_65_14]|nr:MAG: hypothetical protein A3G81_23320 [Betaproteobacteria bacterium RIFCSPLOWO2_12_FULL_65_14]
MKAILTCAFVACLSLRAADIDIKSVYTWIEPSPNRVYQGENDADLYEADRKAGIKGVTVWLYITNASEKDIKIPTKALDRGISGTEKSVTFHLRAAFSDENPLGLMHIIPEAVLAPVVLRKGEVTIIERFAWVPLKKLGTVTVEYEVDKDVAKRYGLWSGKWVGESERLKEPSLEPAGNGSKRK